MTRMRRDPRPCGSQGAGRRLGQQSSWPQPAGWTSPKRATMKSAFGTRPFRRARVVGGKSQPEVTFGSPLFRANAPQRGGGRVRRTGLRLLQEGRRETWAR